MSHQAAQIASAIGLSSYTIAGTKIGEFTPLSTTSRETCGVGFAFRFMRLRKAAL